MRAIALLAITIFYEIMVVQAMAAAIASSAGFAMGFALGGGFVLGLMLLVWISVQIYQGGLW